MAEDQSQIVVDIDEEVLTQFSLQSAYIPSSTSQSIEALAPTNMMMGVGASLERLQAITGMTTDEFVAKCLDVDIETLHRRYAAEQVDALALTNFNRMRNKPTLIANDTGTGKGRIVGGEIAAAIAPNVVPIPDLDKDPSEIDIPEARERIEENLRLLQQAHERGGIAVFITAKPDLYVDMLARDLVDVGIADKVKPFFTNSGLNLDLTAPDGTKTGEIVTLGKAAQEAKMKLLLEYFQADGTLGPNYNVVFTTYDQLKTKDPVKRRFFETIAPGATFILDECDLGGGASGPKPPLTSKQQAAGARGEDIRTVADFLTGSVLPRAKSYTLLSATAFKDPFVLSRLLMPKSEIRETGKDGEELAATLRFQGTPAQQDFVNKLALSGELIRVEKSMEGVEFQTKDVPVELPKIGQAIEVMYLLTDFDRAKQDAVEGLKSVYASVASKAGGRDGSNGSGSIDSMNFTQTASNFAQILMFSAKADEIAKTAIEQIKLGRKPKISFYNTMQSAVEAFMEAKSDEFENEILKEAEADGVEISAEELQLKTRERYNDWRNTDPAPVVDMSMGTLLERQLEKLRTLRIKDAYGNVQKVRLSDEELGPVATDIANEIYQMCRTSDWSGLPASPVDYILSEVEKAGYTIGEMSGRSVGIDYSGELPRLKFIDAASASVRSTVKNGFNNGGVDCIITNITTGWSAHASHGVRDQRRRVDIIAQAHPDGNKYVQALGRTNRYGQINPAKDSPDWYSESGTPGWGEVRSEYGILGDFGLPMAIAVYAEGVPYEQRIAANIKRKMKSLNANTSGNTKGSAEFDALDIMNDIGDEVATALMQDFPDMHKRMGNPLDLNDNTVSVPDAVTRITGRSIFLPLQEQARLYRLLEDGVRDLVEQKEALGESPLEQKPLDLQAQTLARMELQSAQSESIFSGATFVETVRIKALRKPFTAQQVAQKLREKVGSAEYPVETASAKDLEESSDVRFEARQWGNRLFTELENRISTQVAQAQEQVDHLSILQERVPPMRTRYDELKTIGDALDDDQKAEMAQLKAEIQAIEKQTGDVLKIKQQIEATDKRWSKVRETFNICKMGQPVTITDKAGTLYGVVTDIIRVEDVKNPLAGGAWKFKISVVDSAREVTLRMSDINTTGKVKVEPVEQGTFYDPPRFRQMAIGQMFDESQAISYETRQIVTGNLLSSPLKGKYISFTTKRGEKRQGLLLPRSFDIEKVMEAEPVPIVEREQLITALNKALPSGEGLKLRSLPSQAISINRMSRFNRNLNQRETGFLIEVASSKEGSVFYKDESLLTLTKTIEGEPGFEKRGRSMKAFVPMENRDALLNWLESKGQKLAVFDAQWKVTARAITGAELKKMEEVREEDNLVDLAAHEFEIQPEYLTNQIAQTRTTLIMEEANRIESMRRRLEMRQRVDQMSELLEAAGTSLDEQLGIRRREQAQRRRGSSGKGSNSKGRGRQNADEPEVNDDDLLPTDDTTPAGTNAAPTEKKLEFAESLTLAYRDYFLAGSGFNSIVQAREFGQAHLLTQGFEGELADKTLEESIEKGVVLASRQFVDQAKGDRVAAFDKLLDLYRKQPRLASRTSTSIIRQQYSTPAPIGILVQQLAGITTDTTVYEPTAGNGALLTGADPKNVVVNEIDANRVAQLKAQGFTVNQQDATQFRPQQKTDAVVLNPPFGAVFDSETGRPKTWATTIENPVEGTQNYTTTQIDQAIAFNALEVMKDDGRSVLILGAPLEQKMGMDASDAYNNDASRAFFHTLYNNYNVSQHFTIAGELYAKQGTTFPIDVIVIEGKGQSELPLPAVQTPPVYATWDQVRQVMVDSVAQEQTREKFAETIAGLNALLQSSDEPQAEPGTEPEAIAQATETQKADDQQTPTIERFVVQSVTDFLAEGGVYDLSAMPDFSAVLTDSGATAPDIILLKQGDSLIFEQPMVVQQNGVKRLSFEIDNRGNLALVETLIGQKASEQPDHEIADALLLAWIEQEFPKSLPDAMKAAFQEGAVQEQPVTLALPKTYYVVEWNSAERLRSNGNPDPTTVIGSFSTPREADQFGNSYIVSADKGYLVGDQTFIDTLSSKEVVLPDQYIYTLQLQQQEQAAIKMAVAFTEKAGVDISGEQVAYYSPTIQVDGQDYAGWISTVEGRLSISLEAMDVEAATDDVLPVESRVTASFTIHQDGQLKFEEFLVIGEPPVNFGSGALGAAYALDHWIINSVPEAMAEAERTRQAEAQSVEAPAEQPQISTISVEENAEFELDTELYLVIGNSDYRMDDILANPSLPASIVGPFYGTVDAEIFLEEENLLDQPNIAYIEADTATQLRQQGRTIHHPEDWSLEQGFEDLYATEPPAKIQANSYYLFLFESESVIGPFESRQAIESFTNEQPLYSERSRTIRGESLEPFLLGYLDDGSQPMGMVFEGAETILSSITSPSTFTQVAEAQAETTSRDPFYAVLSDYGIPELLSNPDLQAIIVGPFEVQENVETFLESIGRHNFEKETYLKDSNIIEQLIGQGRSITSPERWGQLEQEAERNLPDIGHSPKQQPDPREGYYLLVPGVPSPIGPFPDSRKGSEFAAQNREDTRGYALRDWNYVKHFPSESLENVRTPEQFLAEEYYILPTGIDHHGRDYRTLPPVGPMKEHEASHLANRMIPSNYRVRHQDYVESLGRMDEVIPPSEFQAAIEEFIIDYRQAMPIEPDGAEETSRREVIVEQYRQRIQQGKRTKLTKNELAELQDSFIDFVGQANSPEEIEQLCQNEIALLGEGYSRSSVAGHYIPRYREAIEKAVDSGRLQTPEGVEQHLAFQYLKYSKDIPAGTSMPSSTPIPIPVKATTTQAKPDQPQTEPTQAQSATQAKSNTAKPKVKAQTKPAQTVTTQAESDKPQAELTQASINGLEPRDAIVDRYHTRITNGDRPRLHKPEVTTLASHFTQSLQSVGSSEDIEALFEAEMQLFEEGYKPSSIQEYYLPVYADAIAKAGLPERETQHVLELFQQYRESVTQATPATIKKQTPEVAVAAASEASTKEETLAPVLANTKSGREPGAIAFGKTTTSSGKPMPIKKQSVTTDEAFQAMGVSAMEITQKLIQAHDPATYEALQAESQKYSPSLQEMQDWITNAQTLGKSAAYLGRIEQLVAEMTQDDAFDLESLDGEYKNKEFTLSDKALSAMLKDAEQARNVEIATHASFILKHLGVDKGKHVEYSRPNGEYGLIFTKDSQHLQVLSRSRQSVILSATDGKVDHSSSQVTENDRQIISAFAQAVQKSISKSQVNSARD